jgi:nickel/cobalt transporter (NicO) family protein
VLMGSALMMGAAHALEPGHGKTLLSVHFSSSRSRLRDAAMIGVLITLLHAASIIVYGLIGVGLAHTFFNSTEAVIKAGAVLAGAALLLLGVWWTWQAWQPVQTCHHHDHEPIQNWASFQRQLTLSLASSLVPCPSAIIVVTTMVTMGGAAQAWHAGLFLVLFSLGLSLTLIVAGVLLSASTRPLTRYLTPIRSQVLPLLRKTSAIAMVLLGGFILGKALWFTSPSEVHEFEHVLHLVHP